MIGLFTYSKVSLVLTLEIGRLIDELTLRTASGLIWSRLGIDRGGYGMARFWES